MRHLVLGWFIFLLPLQLSASEAELLEIIEQLQSRIEKLETQLGIPDEQSRQALEKIDLKAKALSVSNRRQMIEWSVKDGQARDVPFEEQGFPTDKKILESVTPQPVITSPAVENSFIPKPAEHNVQQTEDGTSDVVSVLPGQAVRIGRDAETWRLGLNIASDRGSDISQPVMVWQDVNYEFTVTDELGQPHLLAIRMEMQGDGQRYEAGKSFILRRPRYDYDFDLVVNYHVFLDGARVHKSKMNLMSDNFDLDRNGRISASWLFDPALKTTGRLETIGVSINYGCLNSKEVVAEGNRVEGAKIFSHLNDYSCLELKFDDRLPLVAS